MKYLSTTEIAKKWGISSTRVIILAKEGKIEGAVKSGSRYIIPITAKKPLDGRTKIGKTNKLNKELFFRFPIFEGRDENEFDPPLSNEEIILKNTSEAFHACNFNQAEIILGNLIYTTKNRYNRIMALYYSCMIYFALNKTDSFFKSYNQLKIELSKNFPRKKEMSILLPEVDTIINSYSYFKNDFKIDYNYTYHESFLPHLTYLSIQSYFYSRSFYDEKDLLPYELICNSFNQTKCYPDLQLTHIYLSIIYGLLNKKNEMNSHLSFAFDIAIEHNLFWLPSWFMIYFNDYFSITLKKYPKDFSNKLISFSQDIHRRNNCFATSLKLNTDEISISKHYTIYILYAVQGYSTKEIAKILNTSEKYINNVYCKIYQLLNVHNKKQLIEYYLNVTNNPFPKN